MALLTRRATEADAALLAELNQQLILDEGHRNTMTPPELEKRMADWLKAGYTAIFFDHDGKLVAYALYREEPESIYLRQFFVLRPARSQGHGREAFQLLRSDVWPSHKRLTVDVLTGNPDAISFYKAAGFQEYCLTLEILPD